jgi:hypothetical protein
LQDAACFGGKETIMGTDRVKMTKEELDLFQKATEAMRLFSHDPDAMRGFVDALKKGEFSKARKSLNVSLDRPRKGGLVTTDLLGVPSDTQKKK